MCVHWNSLSPQYVNLCSIAKSKKLSTLTLIFQFWFLYFFVLFSLYMRTVLEIIILVPSSYFFLNFYVLNKLSCNVYLYKSLPFSRDANDQIPIHIATSKGIRNNIELLLREDPDVVDEVDNWKKDLTNLFLNKWV